MIKSVSIANGVIEVNGKTLSYQLNGMSQKKADALVPILQALLDSRTPLADLPADDPDKTVDPNRQDLFWDGTELVGRHVTVGGIDWDGNGLSVRLRNTKPISRV